MEEAETGLSPATAAETAGAAAAEVDARADTDEEKEEVARYVDADVLLVRGDAMPRLASASRIACRAPSRASFLELRWFSSPGGTEDCCVIRGASPAIPTAAEPWSEDRK